MLTVRKLGTIAFCVVVLCMAPFHGRTAFAQQAEADVLLAQATVAYDDQQYCKALSLS